MVDPSPNANATTTRPTPAAAVPDQYLWSESVLVSPDGLQMTSFRTSDGERFSLRRGEELVWVRLEDGQERQPFVRTEEGLVTFQEYRSSEREQVIRANCLKLGTIDPQLVELYQQAVHTVPELGLVRIHLADKSSSTTLKVTGGFFRAPENDSRFLDVTVSTDGDAHMRSLIESRTHSVDASMKLLGLTSADAMEHPSILRNFIVLHELGHAVDFLTNYLAHAEDTETAYLNYRRVRQEQLNTLPLPGYSPDKLNDIFQSGELKEIMVKYSEYFVKIGAATPLQLIEMQDLEYRKLPSEAGPDSFAAQIILATPKR